MSCCGGVDGDTHKELAVGSAETGVSLGTRDPLRLFVRAGSIPARSVHSEVDMDTSNHHDMFEKVKRILRRMFDEPSYRPFGEDRLALMYAAESGIKSVVRWEWPLLYAIHVPSGGPDGKGCWAMATRGDESSVLCFTDREAAQAEVDRLVADDSRLFAGASVEQLMAARMSEFGDAGAYVVMDVTPPDGGLSPKEVGRAESR